MKKLLLEFRDFAMRGNVVDMAVGVIIGTAFNAIINSLVKDIIMPLLSILIGRINVTDMKAVIPGILGSNSITISYGIFLQSVINFIIITFSIFCMIKILNKIRRKQEVKEEVAPQITKSEELLTEIRDILQKQQYER